MNTKLIIIQILSIFLLACGSQAYIKKEAGWSRGYVDRALDNNIYHIAFYAKAGTQRKTIVLYWHRRAAELCNGSHNYEVFTEWNLSGSTIQEMDPALNGPPYDVKFSYTGNYTTNPDKEDKDFEISNPVKNDMINKHGYVATGIAESIAGAIDKPLTKVLYGKDPINYVQGYAQCGHENSITVN